MTRQKVLIVVLNLLTVCVLVLAGYLFYRPVLCWWHVRNYTISHDSRSLKWLCLHEIQWGMTRDEMSDLLGPGTEIDDRDRWNEIAGATRYDPHFPDGVEPDDVIVQYPFSWDVCIFQFRRNRLVNYKREWWEQVTFPPHKK